MRISDWSSDVCSSDLGDAERVLQASRRALTVDETEVEESLPDPRFHGAVADPAQRAGLGIHQPQRVAVGGEAAGDRTSVGLGESVSVRVDLGGGRSINKKNRVYIFLLQSILTTQPDN